MKELKGGTRILDILQYAVKAPIESAAAIRSLFLSFFINKSEVLAGFLAYMTSLSP